MNVNKININQSEPTYYIASDIYDVTAHNNGVVFESLQSLLSSSNLNILIPTAVRCGGMSIRFVQSSDNRYVQYRLAASTWSTDIHDWTSEDPYFVDKIMQEVNEAINENTPIEIHGDVTNAPDEEDLTSVNVGGTDVLKFKDKAYNPLTYSGMGKVILRKNMVNGVNTLTQSMINQANTIYIIQYNFTLGGDITVPSNCILEFDGGSINNGLLNGSNLKIIGNDTHIQDIYLDINNGNYCVINNIYFDYTFATRNSINITNTNNISIKGVNITLDTEPLNQGQYIEAEAIRLTSCENINISKCRFINTKSHYIDSDHGIIYGYGCHDIKIKDCYSSGGKNEGFNFTHSTDILFDNIFVENMSGSAIVTRESCKNLTITNTTVKNTGASNLSINSTENVVINNCIIENDDNQSSSTTNGITLGHTNLSSGNIVLSDCIITTTNVTGIGGTFKGGVSIRNCVIKSKKPISLYNDGTLSDNDEVVLEGCNLYAHSESAFNITTSSGIVTIRNCILKNCFYQAYTGSIFNYIGNDVSSVTTHPIIEFAPNNSNITDIKKITIRDNYIHDCSYTTRQQHINAGITGNCIFGSISSSEQTVVKNNTIVISIDSINVTLIGMRAYVGNYIIEGNNIISDIATLITTTTDEGGNYKYCIVNNNIIISSKISIQTIIDNRTYNSVDYVFVNSNYINNKVYYSNMLIGDRPKTEFMTPGAFYFDTTANKLEIYTGNNWVDITGTPV